MIWLFRSEISLDEIRTTLQDRKDVFDFDEVSEHLRYDLHGVSQSFW